jgi:hypothetical protein
MTEPATIAEAARRAVIAVGELPLPLEDQEAALLTAAFTVRQAIVAHQRATAFQRMLQSAQGFFKPPGRP